MGGRNIKLRAHFYSWNSRYIYINTKKVSSNFDREELFNFRSNIESYFYKKNKKRKYILNLHFCYKFFIAKSFYAILNSFTTAIALFLKYYH